jgi:hypothetical protein
MADDLAQETEPQGRPPGELSGIQGVYGVFEALLVAFPAFEDGCKIHGGPPKITGS